jgi:hypothetical protein
MSEIEQQMIIVKRECFKLYELLNTDRVEIKYSKERRFKDIGILDISKILHCYSS